MAAGGAIISSSSTRVRELGDGPEVKPAPHDGECRASACADRRRLDERHARQRRVLSQRLGRAVACVVRVERRDEPKALSPPLSETTSTTPLPDSACRRRPSARLRAASARRSRARTRRAAPPRRCRHAGEAHDDVAGAGRSPQGRERAVKRGRRADGSRRTG